jgi:hypothetical protein
VACYFSQSLNQPDPECIVSFQPPAISGMKTMRELISHTRRVLSAGHAWLFATKARLPGIIQGAASASVTGSIPTFSVFVGIVNQPDSKSILTSSFPPIIV